MRALEGVDAGDVAALTRAVRGALDGSGPAVAVGVEVERGRTVPQPVAVVVGTSGSTGRPKRVLLSSAALLASAAATESALGGPGEWVLALPGHYVAGLQVVVRAIAAGGEPHPVGAGPFTAAGFADAVRGMPPHRRRCSALVPAQVHRLVEAVEGGDAGVADAVRSLDAVLVGGGRLDAALAARARAAGLPVRRTYGSTETAGGCVYDGVPLAGVDVRVVDGEVQLAGPMLAEGYLDDPERTAAVFLEEPGRRWYRTGDAGTWDGARLSVSGRLDDVIVSGGEKVSLGAVQAAVREAGLTDAVVVAVPHPAWGDVPVVVTGSMSSELPLSALRAAVAARLGRAAAPFDAVVRAVPLLPSGKPDLVRLRAELRDAPPG